MRTPARIGQRLAEVLTPALLVSLPALESNEVKMRNLLRTTGVALRPHAKAHKSSMLGRWLLERGGTEVKGFCAQTVGEAEAMVNAGSTDVLLTNILFGPNLARLAGMAAANPHATIGALVDSMPGVEALELAASSAGARITAWVEIDAGQNRCGIMPSDPLVVEISQRVTSSPSLTLGGLHVYHGAIQHVRTAEARQAAVQAGPAAAARVSVDALVAAGLEKPLVTGGGTGTFMFEARGHF